MAKSKVYFTDFHATFDENLLQKLERLVKTAGIKISILKTSVPLSRSISASRATWPICGPIMPR